MSERLYTTLHVSGANAATAEQAAIEALKDLSKDDKPPKWSNECTPEEYEAQWAQKWRGFWYDADTITSWENGTAPDGSHCTHEEAVKLRQELVETGPHFFDHCAGDEAIVTVAKMSRNFPTEVFCLFVDGGYGEGIQGTVTINNGFLIDGRCEEFAYGDEPEDKPPVLSYLDADGNNAIETQTEADAHSAYELMTANVTA
jgi:hypothetical protein